MRRLSSKWTFFHKKIFPVFWLLGMCGFVVAAICTPSSSSPNAPPPIIILIIPAFMTFIGYVLMKNLIWDLLDEVWDEGDRLVLVKGDQRDTILISDILNVSDTRMINPPRITLLLRQPCLFGKEVVFSPARGFQIIAFKRNAIAQELLQRVHNL